MRRDGRIKVTKTIKLGSHRLRYAMSSMTVSGTACLFSTRLGRSLVSAELIIDVVEGKEAFDMCTLFALPN